MNQPSRDQIKERTKHLRQILKEKHNIELPHGHALEVMAKVFGFNDWNTASALASTQQSHGAPAEKQKSESKKELPPAFKLETAGEFVDFFSGFDRSKKVLFNEYKLTELGHIGTLTSICTATYDYEIQNGKDIRLELNTEEERDLQLKDFGESSNQQFDHTKLGRAQRVVKWLKMKTGIWSPNRISNSQTMRIAS